MHRTVEDLYRELRAIPYEPYAPVRDQLRGVLREVNRRRKAAGLELVPLDALGWRRVPVKPFSEPKEAVLEQFSEKSIRCHSWPITLFDE